jgi:methylglutaconyl-CoA hydratase
MKSFLLTKKFTTTTTTANFHRTNKLPLLFTKNYTSLLNNVKSRYLTTSQQQQQQPSIKMTYEDNDTFATMTLNREDVHNAFDDYMIQDMTREISSLKSSTRALFVEAKGKNFCAGGDLNYMKRMAEASEEKNMQDAVALSHFLKKFSDLPFPTIALVQGSAFGGGVGLISVTDIAIAIKTAQFSLSEVKLGLIPATISPYVVRRISPNHAKRFFMTAERFDAEKAYHVGLIHEVVDSMEELTAMKKKFKKIIGNNAPKAVGNAKSLVDLCISHDTIDLNLMKETAKRLASQRSSPEGREGVKAFLEKRSPTFVVKDL